MGGGLFDQQHIYGVTRESEPGEVPNKFSRGKKEENLCSYFCEILLYRNPVCKTSKK